MAHSKRVINFALFFMPVSNEGDPKVFGTLDLFVSLLETEIKYPILQGDILTFGTASLLHPDNFRQRRTNSDSPCRPSKYSIFSRYLWAGLFP